jgi:monofunctional biosynthetic peptidoglycan transglycosylase
VFGAWLAAALSLVALRWVSPPFTAVQAERRMQAEWERKPYHKRYTFVPLDRISPELQHAVVAAEDARFYKHHGFDWVEIRNAVEDDLDDRRVRGASTLTQQLVKNLFLGTSRSFLRKGVEATLVPVAEYTLGKRRILELYLNVVEWGPGVYGAEAAAHYHYSVAARSVGRGQALRLAAVLPAPLRRRPDRVSTYSAVIDERMRQMGW